MGSVLWQTIKDRKISTLVYCLAGVAFMWMYVAMYPSIQAQAAEFAEILKNYPEGFMKAFGVEDLSFDTLEKFLAVEHFSIVWPMLALFMSVSFAGHNLSAEVERGTAELLLSRPVSRTRLFLGKYGAGLAAVALFNVCSIVAAIPLAGLHGVSYQTSHYGMLVLAGFLFSWAVYSLSMLLSAFFSERSKTLMFGGAMLVGMYVIKLVSLLRDQFAVIKWASFFHYFDSRAALVDGSIEWTTYVVFGVVIIAATTAGLWWWNKREIAI